MDGLKEDVQNFQRFQSFGPPRISNYGMSSSDEQLPGSGFGTHSNQYDCTDPGKSVWSFGLYCTIQEDLDLKSWPHFECCKKIWEKVDGRQKVDRGIFTSFADVVRNREDIATERDRGDSNYMSSSRSTISDQFHVKHQDHNVRRPVKASAARSKRPPPCLFQYDDPISEELSLSLEPISSSSSHFSSDCDGENNDGIFLSSLKISKADRDSRSVDERKKQPLLHPRMSTPTSNSNMLSKRRYPPTCHLPYEDSCLEVEDASLEPVSSSSSHFSDVDLELSDIAYLQGRISTIAYANTSPSPTTASQDCTFRSSASQRTIIAQLNVSPPQPSATKEVPIKENVAERTGSQMHHVIFPTTEFPTLTSASNPTSAKTPDSGKIPKLMEIKLDMKDKMDMDTSPLSSESKALENGLLRVAKYNETQKGIRTNESPINEI
ncbi:hypothetical protein Ocin01_01446 [Orchesella cincta]|uniref:Uncharacterized protein n=1 Tax=Orchesella cincta TaxID=48709 RepID=A0A1D2NJ57_ORCCI|nr:hypothetical protein Ocin01_01446 [Orchesella cincta]